MSSTLNPMGGLTCWYPKLGEESPPFGNNTINLPPFGSPMLLGDLRLPTINASFLPVWRSYILVSKRGRRYHNTSNVINLLFVGNPTSPFSNQGNLHLLPRVSLAPTGTSYTLGPFFMGKWNHRIVSSSLVHWGKVLHYLTSRPIMSSSLVHWGKVLHYVSYKGVLSFLAECTNLPCWGALHYQPPY